MGGRWKKRKTKVLQKFSETKRYVKAFYSQQALYDTSFSLAVDFHWWYPLWPTISGPAAGAEENETLADNETIHLQLSTHRLKQLYPAAAFIVSFWDFHLIYTALCACVYQWFRDRYFPHFLDFSIDWLRVASFCSHLALALILSLALGSLFVFSI